MGICWPPTADGVYTIDSAETAKSGQSPTCADCTPTVRIWRRFVKLKHFAAIQASHCGVGSHFPKIKRETLTALAHRLSVSRKHFYRVLCKTAVRVIAIVCKRLMLNGKKCLEHKRSTVSR